MPIMSYKTPFNEASEENNIVVNSVCVCVVVQCVCFLCAFVYIVLECVINIVLLISTHGEKQS